MNMEIKEEVKTAELHSAEGGSTPSADVAPVKRKRGRPRTLPGTVNVADVVKAVMETGGHVQDTISVLGMSNGDFYKRFRHNPKVEKAFAEARRIGFESVTDVLYSLALKGDMKAMSLYLKYNPIAKENNWVEVQTVTLKQERPLTEEEKKALAKELFG